MLAGLLLHVACTAVPPAPSVPKTPRWVSLSPSMTEILFAVGAGPEVAGVCAPATFPPQAATLPAVAAWDRLDVERVLALTPSACFTLEGMQPPQSLDALRRLGVEVDTFSIRSLEDLWACMESVGRRTGHERQAREVVTGLKERVAKAGADLSGPLRRTLVVVGLDPLVAAGPGSFISAVLRAAGYENALKGVGDAYPVLSMEAAAAAGPEVLLFPEGEISVQTCARFVADLGRLTAKPLQSIAIPADLLVRPGPRTADAVEALAAARRAGIEEQGILEKPVGDGHRALPSPCQCPRRCRMGRGGSRLADSENQPDGGFPRFCCVVSLDLHATCPVTPRLCQHGCREGAGALPYPSRASRPWSRVLSGVGIENPGLGPLGLRCGPSLLSLFTFHFSLFTFHPLPSGGLP